MLSWSQIEDRAVKFQRYWKNSEGNEKQEGQKFQVDFMNVFGVHWKDGFHEHQIYLKDGSIGYIDYFIPGKILIEMKSKGQSLTKAYSQAMGYVHSLKPEELPVLVVVCDFDTMQVYNLEKDHRYKPFKISRLKNNVRTFGILSGYGTTDEVQTEIELNTDASYKMAKLHDQLKEIGYEGHDLEMYLVRLLFCLFAEDTGIFERYSFRTYIKESKQNGTDLAMRLMALFEILNTPMEERLKNASEELKRFRYINGNLFNERLKLASFDSDMRKILLECCEFTWSEINPAIFGAIFQGVMNQEERRNLGAHYTSEENIMKVLEPLFLEELYTEFEKSKSTIRELRVFQDKLASLSFLDPACGSGNFLVITYQKLRDLEFEVIKMIYDGDQRTLTETMTKVTINQFYGIEYEDFPTEVAKVSMILMKHLMDQQINNHFGYNTPDFPIKENSNIINGNALKLDWDTLISAKKLDYIIGNPPFIGARLMNSEQKSDMKHVFQNLKNMGNLDYVAAWYSKAADMIEKNNDLRVAFVSTDSICQGQQVSVLWKYILENKSCKIDFAYKSFKWSNEAKYKAAVYCIIIGFSSSFKKIESKTIYEDDGTIKEAQNINGYLIDAPNLYISNRRKSICDVMPMNYGSFALDNGAYTISEKEYNKIIDEEPFIDSLIRPFIGAAEFLRNKKRYCLWLKDADLSVIKRSKIVKEKIEHVQEWRYSSTRKETNSAGDTPMIFAEIRQPNKSYLAIPVVSSERRKYIPIGYMSPNIIASNQLLIIPKASLYMFGILSSNVHMAWMRTVAGRLKKDYRYSTSIVYNNFPWPNEIDKFKNIISEKANIVLNTRKKYPDSSYADLYDPLFMPIELLRAHRELDKAVWEAYGKSWNISSEEDCIEHLMKLYNSLISNI